ncbi:death-associated protein 1-like [Amphiura filiformis]|uniref:death-associated protein 1-like n=1 Tax=Amphiura filiformis TaxID=82378 RepID=UPI003B21A5A8
MSAATEVEGELKAGHPPAVKAGGMRIVQSGKTPEKAAAGDKPAEDDEEEFEEAKSPPKDVSTLLISGAPSRGNKDFPPEAVKAYHEKPLPTHNKNVSVNKPMHNLNQPRK